MVEDGSFSRVEPAIVRGSGSRVIIAIAAVVSVLWLGFGIVGLGLLAQNPDGCTGTFSCLSIEGWGTYLAGIFAPVAFFWLVAAVLLQSSELREQRHELALTRQEFAYNREVMKAQAVEAKSQAAYIGQQTKFLEMAEADRALFNHMRLLQHWVTTYCSKGGVFMDGIAARPTELGYLTKDMPDDPQDFFVELVRRMLLATDDAKNGNDKRKIDLNKIDKRHLYYLCDRLMVIAEMEDRVSAAMRAVIRASNVSWIIWEMPPILPPLGEADKEQFPHLFKDATDK